MIVVRVWRGLELNLFAAVNVVVARTQKEGGANKQNREGEAPLFERDVSALVSVDIFQPNFDDDEDDGDEDDGDEDDGDGRSVEGARSTKRKTATWRNDDQPSGRKTESNVSLSPTSRSEWDKFNLTRECSEFRLL